MSTHLTAHQLSPLGAGSAQVQCWAAPHRPMGSPQGGKEDPRGGSPGSCRFREQWLPLQPSGWTKSVGCWGRRCSQGRWQGSTLRNVSTSHCWGEAKWREQGVFIAGLLFELQCVFIGWRESSSSVCPIPFTHPILSGAFCRARLIVVRGFSWVYSCGWITADTNFFWSALGLG